MGRTTKICAIEARSGSGAYQYFGYEDGVAVYQSTKLWRHRADCARAAKAWERKV